MTITQLHYVLAVAEQQNFTKAAEKCFVTQPTLSMQIQKLEDGFFQSDEMFVFLFCQEAIRQLRKPQDLRKMSLLVSWE